QVGARFELQRRPCADTGLSEAITAISPGNEARVMLPLDVGESYLMRVIAAAGQITTWHAAWRALDGPSLMATIHATNPAGESIKEVYSVTSKMTALADNVASDQDPPGSMGYGQPVNTPYLFLNVRGSLRFQIERVVPTR